MTEYVEPISEHIECISEHEEDTPENVENIPENVEDIPENVEDIPEIVEDIPEKVEDLPEYLPEYMTDISSLAADRPVIDYDEMPYEKLSMHSEVYFSNQNKFLGDYPDYVDTNELIEEEPAKSVGDELFMDVQKELMVDASKQTMDQSKHSRSKHSNKVSLAQSRYSIDSWQTALDNQEDLKRKSMQSINDQFHAEESYVPSEAEICCHKISSVHQSIRNDCMFAQEDPSYSRLNPAIDPSYSRFPAGPSYSRFPVDAQTYRPSEPSYSRFTEQQQEFERARLAAVEDPAYKKTVFLHKEPSYSKIQLNNPTSSKTTVQESIVPPSEHQTGDNVSHYKQEEMSCRTSSVAQYDVLDNFLTTFGLGKFVTNKKNVQAEPHLAEVPTVNDEEEPDANAREERKIIKYIEEVSEQMNEEESNGEKIRDVGEGESEYTRNDYNAHKRNENYTKQEIVIRSPSNFSDKSEFVKWEKQPTVTSISKITSREVVIKDDKSLKSVVDLRNIPDSQLTFGQLREKHLLVNPKQSIHLPIRDQTTSSVDSQQTYRVNYTVFREDGVSLKGSKVGMLGGPTKNVKEQILKELKNLPEDVRSQISGVSNEKYNLFLFFDSEIKLNTAS